MCIPYLKKSKHAHILNISPPLNMNPNWFSNHVAYTMAKYGMSMCVLGMSNELRADNIAVNALWPRTGNGITIIDNFVLKLKHKLLFQNKLKIYSFFIPFYFIKILILMLHCDKNSIDYAVIFVLLYIIV